jgi:hypothetical protein
MHHCGSLYWRAVCKPVPAESWKKAYKKPIVQTT